MSSDTTAAPQLPITEIPRSLHDLAATPEGGFVLAPGFYEAEFKTYCLEPGTPAPSSGDAYLQGALTGYRKDIVQSVLLKSRENPRIEQKHVQLLLWSIVSGSDFNKLSSDVQSDAYALLTPKQVFELRGGIMGAIKTVSAATGLNTNSSMQRLFDMGTTSYENFERLAVLREPTQVRRPGIKYDQWYRQKENYYVRYFPASYKQVRIQIYVPDSLLDKEGKRNGDYMVFDPTGSQAIPAFTNAQRLGIGAPVVDIIRQVILVNHPTGPKKIPEKKKPTNNKGL